MRLKYTALITFFCFNTLFAQSPYSTKEQSLLNFIVKAFPVVGPEFDREYEPLVPYDYIHDSYKRRMEGNGFEVHFDTSIGGVFNKKYSSFQMPHTYLSLSKSFFSFWYLGITPFITVSSDYNSFNKENNFNINMYDAGIQIIGLSHILFSARLRALNDFSSASFMLSDYLVSEDNSTFYSDTTGILPRLNNGAGIRVGLIGNYYELSFSQSYLGDANNPFTILARVKLDDISVQALYGYAKKSFYKLSNLDNMENYNKHVFQLSANAKIPLPVVIHNRAMYFNGLAEYTFINNNANYIRLEEGIEWRIFNLALREIIYIPKVKDDKPPFLFEYALYIKYDPLTVGFQGSTDGRYYILTKVLF